MKTYLVTGAAGFIGSNFVKYILNKYGDNIEIIILDALTYAGNLASIKSEIERSNVTFIRGDVGDRELVQGIMHDFDVDYIVNFHKRVGWCRQTSGLELPPDGARALSSI